MFRVPLRSFLRSAPERLRRPSQRYWDVQKKDCTSNFTKKAALFKNSPSQNPRKTLFVAPLLENQRSVDSCNCKIVAHNILCIHLATFTTNVVQIATFRVNVIKIKCWMEPAYNRRTVKNERASVYLGSSIPRLRARFIERVKILAKLYIQGQCYSSSMLGEPSLQSKNR